MLNISIHHLCDEIPDQVRDDTSPCGRPGAVVYDGCHAELDSASLILHLCDEIPDQVRDDGCSCG